MLHFVGLSHHRRQLKDTLDSHATLFVELKAQKTQNTSLLMTKSLFTLAKPKIMQRRHATVDAPTYFFHKSRNSAPCLQSEIIVLSWLNRHLFLEAVSGFYLWLRLAAAPLSGNPVNGTKSKEKKIERKCNIIFTHDDQLQQDHFGVSRQLHDGTKT